MKAPEDTQRRPRGRVLLTRGERTLQGAPSRCYPAGI